jgi:vanillin dehydrogenase
MLDAADLTTESKLWIGGDWVSPTGENYFDDLNPEDDSLYGRSATGTSEDMLKAVEAAKETFKEYGSTTAKEREAWIMRAAEVMASMQDEFVAALIDEIGSPINKAMFEFNKALSMMRAASGMARQATGKTIPSDYPGRYSMSVRQPLGVVAAITPFNVPLIKGVRLTADPLAVGNTVVLLASEFAPRLSLLLAQVYEKAGLPAGAFNVVTGYGHEIGDSLTGHPDVPMVTFTGSSVVGQHINELCAKQKKRVTLELGGKSPFVVLADADLKKAVQAACHGIFIYQGQVCMGGSRIYVEAPLYDKFVEVYASAASNLGMGDLRSTDTMIGPIISERQRNRVRTHIEDARDKGATIVTGGDWNGNRCQPTILTGVSEEMTVCREETFGPVTSVYKVDSYEEALEKSNDSEYGLSSTIFTENLNKALHYAHNVTAGMCHVNGSPVHDEPHVPFGGNGESGIGREGTEADIDAMTEWKWITIQT